MIQKFMAYLKEQYLSEMPTTDDEIRKLITDGALHFGLNIDEAHIESIMEMLKKLTLSGIDMSQFKEPVGKPADHEAVPEGDHDAASSGGNWFLNIINVIVEFFNGLFKRIFGYS